MNDADRVIAVLGNQMQHMEQRTTEGIAEHKEFRARIDALERRFALWIGIVAGLSAGTGSVVGGAVVKFMG